MFKVAASFKIDYRFLTEGQNKIYFLLTNIYRISKNKTYLGIIIQCIFSMKVKKDLKFMP
jgi:hypothetical protein